MKKLPIYEIIIDEALESESEVNFVALVDRPAIQKDFMAFNEQKPLQFEVISEERRIVSGPLMLADLPIYRIMEGEEFYVTFSKDTIEKIALKFFKKGYQSNVNMMHDPEQKVSGVTMFESWIVDKARGIQPMKGFEDAADGSWFGSFKIEDEETWEKVKSGEVKGFSVEGMFGMKPQKMKDETLFNQIIDILKEV